MWEKGVCEKGGVWEKGERRTRIPVTDPADVMRDQCLICIVQAVHLLQVVLLIG